MLLWQQLLASIAVGLLWGISNPLSRQGALQLQRRQQLSSPADRGGGGSGWLRTINHVLRTPLLILPQVESCTAPFESSWCSTMSVCGMRLLHPHASAVRQI